MPSMLPIIIFSAVVPIALVVLFLVVLMKRQAATDKLIQTGRPARGRILQLGTTGQSVAVMGHRHLKLVLTVEVHAPQAQPYVATFEQLISELQIPSVQPGAEIDLRIDPTNPARMAMAGVMPQGMGYPQQPQGMGYPQQPQGMGYPQQPQAMGMGYPQQQAWGAAPVAKGGAGFGPAPIPMGVMQPNYKRSLPFIVFMLFITTVPITAIMLYTFVDFGDLFGGSKDGKGSVCEQAEACCEVVSGNKGSCENVKMMPVEGCRTMLEEHKKAAKALGKSCD